MEFKGRYLNFQAVKKLCYNISCNCNLLFSTLERSMDTCPFLYMKNLFLYMKNLLQGLNWELSVILGAALQKMTTHT